MTLPHASDSPQWISTFPVRKMTNYGLAHPDYPFFCPNGWRLRTCTSSLPLLLSEWLLTSDSYFRISVFPVRIGTDFGLVPPIFAFPVRMVTDFGLIPPDYPFFCLNDDQLRTRHSYPLCPNRSKILICTNKYNR